MCSIGLFFASVCIPNHLPKFFNIALSEKLLLVLSEERMTWRIGESKEEDKRKEEAEKEYKI